MKKYLIKSLIVIVICFLLLFMASLFTNQKIERNENFLVIVIGVVYPIVESKFAKNAKRN